MNDDVLRDLERWEKGDLDSEEIAARHPEHQGLLRVHRSLREVASAPLPPAERSWHRVRLSLGAPGRRRFWRMSPAIALGAIALLASMGAVAAATAPVQTAQAIDHVLHVVGHHQHGQHPPVQHAPAHPPSPTPHPPSSPSHAPSPTPHR